MPWPPLPPYNLLTQNRVLLLFCFFIVSAFDEKEHILNALNIFLLVCVYRKQLSTFVCVLNVLNFIVFKLRFSGNPSINLQLCLKPCIFTKCMVRMRLHKPHTFPLETAICYWRQKQPMLWKHGSLGSNLAKIERTSTNWVNQSINQSFFFYCHQTNYRSLTHSLMPIMPSGM